MKTKDYKRIVDGGICEIPLWGNFGFAYAKYIDGRKHAELEPLVSILKVYKFRSKGRLNDLSILESLEYLNDRILVAGIFPTINKGYWKVVGRDDLTDIDLQPLVLKKENPLTGKWYLTINGSKKIETPENINWNNYEHYSYASSGNIEIRLSLEFMKAEGFDPDKFLDLNDERINWIYKKVFEYNN